MSSSPCCCRVLAKIGPCPNPTYDQLKEFKNDILEGNKMFTESATKEDPEYFKRLEKSQHPHTLWIGCSDSRIPADTITQTVPGELFMHRNIANTVVHTDFNLLSVLHYAVEFLDVKQIVVCGHYGCGGIKASLSEQLPHGIIENWLLQIQQTYRSHADELNAITDPAEREARLAEKHVIEGVRAIASTSIIQQAWHRKTDYPYPHITGLIYGLDHGDLKELITISSPSQVKGYLHGKKGIDPSAFKSTEIPDTSCKRFPLAKIAPSHNPSFEQLKAFKADLLLGNKLFIEKAVKNDPEYFTRLAKSQYPHTLWIGCSDSRIPADTITQTVPGELFVHRNIANTVVHTDFNLLSVLHYAVEFLNVKQIVICGHYNCGGIRTSLSEELPDGIIENWLLQIQQSYREHEDELEAITDQHEKECRLAERHVLEGVRAIASTSIVQQAWQQRAENPYPHIHGMIYDLSDGRLKDLVSITNPSQVESYLAPPKH